MDVRWWVAHEGDSDEAFLGFQRILGSIVENKQNFLLFVNNKKNNAFEVNFFEYYKEMQKIEEQDEYQKYLFTYHTMGYAAVVQNWLYSGCQMPYQELAKLLWEEAIPFHKMMQNR